MDQKLSDIIKGTSVIFKKYGIRSVSMDDICRELGISKKTLYQYVENKTDLVNKVLETEHISMKEEFEKTITENENAIDQLLAVSILVSKKISETTLSLKYDLAKYFPESCKNENINRRVHVYDKVKANLELGIKQGLYREDMQTELIARLYIQKIENVLDSEHLLSKEFSASDFFKAMFENHIRGIANEKGISYYEEKIKTLNIKF